jgi:KUP system potassium uptake protein
MKAILSNYVINADIVLGISCVFWTAHTNHIKYVIITLSADNHGEGGIFAFVCPGQKKQKK